jgi:uncharacterized RDD family membrane protein YckC
VASGGRDTTAPGWPRLAEQSLIAICIAGYFLGSWLRGGQTLPMKAWRIRLTGVTPARALARLVLAAALLPTGLSILWVLFDREGQFLHDRLAGTRLIAAPPTTS